MPRKSPGARSKSLGSELKRCRAEANLSLAKAALATGMAKTILTRIENGERNISIEDTARILGAYRVTGPTYDLLMHQARTLDEPGWWEHGLDGLHPESKTLADYESRATGLTNWSPLMIPGMLQTLDYARGGMEVHDLEPAAIDVRLTARLRRQQTLLRPDVTYTAFIGEPALRTLVGGTAVQVAQLRILIAAADRANISIRIVPVDSAGHPGQTGAFLLLEGPPRQGFPVVHVEMATSGAFLDKEPQVKPYFSVLDRIAGVALGAKESVGFIAQIADGMENKHGHDTGEVAQVEP